MGLAWSSVKGTLVDRAYEALTNKKIQNFGEFHVAFLEMFTKINSILFGMHLDAPTLEEVEKSYQLWKDATTEDKKKVVLLDLLNKAKSSKTDRVTLLTGAVAPPAWMIAKKTGENIPPLNMIRVIPDVIFVPSATLLSVLAVKFFRKSIKGTEDVQTTTKTTSDTTSDSSTTTKTTTTDSSSTIQTTTTHKPEH